MNIMDECVIRHVDFPCGFAFKSVKINMRE